MDHNHAAIKKMILRISRAMVNAMVEHPVYKRKVNLLQRFHAIRDLYELLCPDFLQWISVFQHSLPPAHVGLSPGQDLIPSGNKSIKKLLLVKNVTLKTVPLAFLFIPLATLPSDDPSPASS